MSGYCAVGSFVMATAAAIVIRIAMTIATIGRRTKKAPTCLLGAFRRCASRFLGHDGHPGPDALQALHDDSVAGVQTFLDDPQVSLDRPGLDDLDRRLVVRSHDGDLIAALKL